MPKTALVTGITGQDASFLSEQLLARGYEVHGLVRQSATDPFTNIKHLLSDPNFHIHYGDMATENQLCTLLDAIRPDEIYNLAGQSDVAASFQIPEYTGDVTGLGVTRLLEAMRTFSPYSKLYQASSSELFGNASPPPQNERSPMSPRSPYACAKLYAHSIVRCYRESYGLFACSGILFNHESERRGLNFVTRKISKAAAKIKLKKQDCLELGNLDAARDWGYSPDYCRAMQMMLQQEKPDDFVVGTGVSHTVRDFAEAAFDVVGLDWKKHTLSNTKEMMRPSDVNYLRADPSKARKVLGWEPQVGFEELVRIMVEHDLKEEAATCQ